MVDQLIKKLYFGIDLLVSFLSCVSHAERNVLYCTLFNICPVFVMETCRLQHIWSCRGKHINMVKCLICDTSRLLVENWLSSWITGSHKSLPLWLYECMLCMFFRTWSNLKFRQLKPPQGQNECDYSIFIHLVKVSVCTAVTLGVLLINSWETAKVRFSWKLSIYNQLFWLLDSFSFSATSGLYNSARFCTIFACDEYVNTQIS